MISYWWTCISAQLSSFSKTMKISTSSLSGIKFERKKRFAIWLSISSTYALQSEILCDTVRSVYVDQLYCYCVFICSNVHWHDSLYCFYLSAKSWKKSINRYRFCKFYMKNIVFTNTIHTDIWKTTRHPICTWYLTYLVNVQAWISLGSNLSWWRSLEVRL